MGDVPANVEFCDDGVQAVLAVLVDVAGVCFPTVVMLSRRKSCS